MPENNDLIVAKIHDRVQAFGFDQAKRFQLKMIAEEKGFTSISGLLSNYLNELLSEKGFEIKSKTDIDRLKNRMMIALRFNENDFELLESQAKDLGYPSRSRYAKVIIQNHLKNLSIKPISAEQKALLHESNTNLERIGRNVNQIARQFNTDGYLPKDRLTLDMLVSLREFIEQHCAKIDEILSVNQEVFRDKGIKDKERKMT